MSRQGLRRDRASAALRYGALHPVSLTQHDHVPHNWVATPLCESMGDADLLKSDRRLLFLHGVFLRLRGRTSRRLSGCGATFQAERHGDAMASTKVRSILSGENRVDRCLGELMLGSPLAHRLTTLLERALGGEELGFGEHAGWRCGFRELRAKS